MNKGNSFFNNLFGTIAQNGLLGREPGNISFIPKDNAGNTIKIKGQNAIWLGLRNRIVQYWAYQYCSPLATVIERLAEADITGELQFIREKGKGAADIATNPFSNRLRTLFANPNPLQSWEQFRGQQVVYKKIFGFCPVLIVKPAGFTDASYASLMVNLPPWLFTVVGTNKLLCQTDVTKMIEKYTISLIGETIDLKPEDVIILSDTFVQDENYNYLLPKSKMVGLDMAVSNYCAAMEADNVLLRKKGPLGAWTHDAAATKDSVAGYLPMTVKEKDQVQTDLGQYGLNWEQFQSLVTRTAIKWQPTSFNVTELGTSDTITKATKAICHRYGYSYILLEDSDATFSNQGGAAKSLFQNNIIPNNKRDMSAYEKFFNCSENNCNIVTDYSDLPILQEDEFLKGRAVAQTDLGLQIEYLNDIITKNQWLTARGYDTIGSEGDKLYSESGLKIQSDAATAAATEALKTNQSAQDVTPKN